MSCAHALLRHQQLPLGGVQRRARGLYGDLARQTDNIVYIYINVCMYVCVYIYI